MSHVAVPLVTSEQKQIKDMSESELIALFEWYEFRDPIGHKLTMCEDFRDLVKAASSNHGGPV